MIKILIKRKASKDKESTLLDYIAQLRSQASMQPGYISGETLRSTERPDEYLVISIWEDEAYWKKWIATDERKAIQDKIDRLVGSPTDYEIYRYPRKQTSVP